MPTKPKATFHRPLAGTAVSFPAGELASQSFLGRHAGLPAVWTPNVSGVDLVDWARLNRDRIQQGILRFGAVLFRGFDVPGPEEFHRVAALLGDAPLSYAANIFPKPQGERSLRAGSIHPPVLSLTWHNENSFDEARWARRIMFYAYRPAAEGGETPICDGRALLRAIEPEVATELMRRGVCYVRNYHEALGNSWRVQFQASTREEVEAHARAWAMDVEWLAEDRLRTRCRRPAVIRHPQTRELVWFNVLQMWHPYGVAPQTREAWRGAFAEEDFPTTCTYGDGAPIDDATVAEIYRAYSATQVTFSWRPGDILILDNLQVTHGRNPFSGPREHYVVMDRPITLHDIPPDDRVWSGGELAGACQERNEPEPC